MHPTKPRRARTGLAAAALTLLSGSACGNDADPTYEAKVEGDLTGRRAGSLVLTADEADCTARKVARSIPEYRLQELGIETVALEDLDLSISERTILYNALDACLDLEGQETRIVSAGSQMTQDQARCVARRYITSKAFREAVTTAAPSAALRGQIDAAVHEAVQACGAPAPTTPR